MPEGFQCDMCKQFKVYDRHNFGSWREGLIGIIIEKTVCEPCYKLVCKFIDGDARE